MYCNKCGQQINPKGSFCPKCGNRIKVIRNHPAAGTVKRNRYAGISAIAVLAVIVVIVVVKIAGGNGGYEKVIEKYVQAIQEEDGELLCSLYAPDYVKYMVGPGSFYSEMGDYIDDLTEECEDKHEDLSSGIEKHPDIAYEIISEEPLDEADLERLNRSLEDYDFEEDSVSEACYVTFLVYIPGGEDRYRCEQYMLKIHGKWYMNRGYIDL